MACVAVVPGASFSRYQRNRSSRVVAPVAALALACAFAGAGRAATRKTGEISETTRSVRTEPSGVACATALRLPCLVRVASCKASAEDEPFLSFTRITPGSAAAPEGANREGVVGPFPASPVRRAVEAEGSVGWSFGTGLGVLEAEPETEPSVPASELNARNHATPAFTQNRLVEYMLRI